MGESEGKEIDLSYHMYIKQN